MSNCKSLKQDNILFKLGEFSHPTSLTGQRLPGHWRDHHSTHDRRHSYLSTAFILKAGFKLFSWSDVTPTRTLWGISAESRRKVH